MSSENGRNALEESAYQEQRLVVKAWRVMPSGRCSPNLRSVERAEHTIISMERRTENNGKRDFYYLEIRKYRRMREGFRDCCHKLHKGPPGVYYQKSSLCHQTHQRKLRERNPWGRVPGEQGCFLVGYWPTGRIDCI